LNYKNEIKIGNKMAGFTLIADLVAAGQEMGIFEFYLPFIITFAIFWALLTKIKLFGDPYPEDDKKKGQARVARSVNLIVALGASLYIMANTELGISFAAFLSGLFGGTFLVLLTIIAFTSVLYVAYSVAGGEDPFDTANKFLSWRLLAAFVVLAAIVFALGVYISSSGAAVFPGLVLPGFEVPSVPTLIFPSIDLSSQDLAIFFLVVVTALIVIYVSRGGGGGGGRGRRATTRPRQPPA